VGDALAEVRRRAGELRIVYEVFVTDPGGVLKGLCTLKELVAAEPTTLLERVTREAPATVGVHASAREIADAASKYNLISVPVVDELGVLMGMVTVDDILPEILHAR
jgi:magnesium transporter